jgi:hypothetical protein
LFAGGLLAGGLLSTVLVACGGYYYSATVQGFIRDADDESGINGVTVRFFEQEPESVDATDFFAETSTADTGGTAGFYSNRVIWQNVFGRFGAEGDTGTIYLVVNHPDYDGQIAEITAVLSDTTNTVRDILLERVVFEVPLVSGRVIDQTGDGVNGVRVVLDLNSTADEDEDYVTTTATVDGVTGIYEFAEVEWADPDRAGEATDEEQVTIRVDDNEYQASQARTIVLTSGVEREVGDPIPTTRAPRTSFNATVEGRTLFRQSTNDDVVETPIPGVVVQIQFTDDAGTTTQETVTDATGTYRFFIEWTDDDGGADPDPDSEDTNVPDAGEDALSVTLDYDASGTTNAGEITGSVDFTVRSWVTPNVVPDQFDTDSSM